MKEDKKITVNVDKDVKTLVIREGDAEKLYEPNKVSITGVITAPQDYWKIRSTVSMHEKKNCYVLFNIDQKSISLICDEKDSKGTYIGGKLTANPDLAGIGINAEKTYTVSDLRQKLKFMRRYFADQDKYALLLNNLEKFKVSVQSQIEKETSDRGNKTDNFNVKVDTNLSLDFVLGMPLFKGSDNTKFKVDICFDVRDKNIEVWMESVELKDAQDSQAEKAIGEVVNYFEAEGLVVIEQ